MKIVANTEIIDETYINISLASQRTKYPLFVLYSSFIINGEIMAVSIKSIFIIITRCFFICPPLLTQLKCLVQFIIQFLILYILNHHVNFR